MLIRNNNAIPLDSKLGGWLATARHIEYEYVRNETSIWRKNDES